MKCIYKSLLILLLAAVSVMMLPLGANAAEEIIVDSTQTTTAAVNLSDFEVVQGETFTTTLTVAKNSNIANMALTLCYDPDKVTLEAWQVNENSIVIPTVNTDTEGMISLSFSNSTNLRSELKIVDFTFKVDPYLTDGSYDLLSLSKDHDNYLNRLNSGVASRVNFTYDCPQLKIYKAGDINLDGVVDANDSTYVRRYAALLDDYSDFALKIADAFADGNVDEQDAVWILRHVSNYNEIMGRRADIVFVDVDGKVYRKLSVPVGEDLKEIPTVPDVHGLINGKWMIKTPDQDYAKADFTNVSRNFTVYAVYEDVLITDAMQYYIDRVIADHEPANSLISNNITLSTGYEQGFAPNYRAEIAWASSRADILNDKGEYSMPAYSSAFSMYATIRVFADGVEESVYTLELPYTTEGLFKTPTKSEIEAYLRDYIGSEITTDLKLPVKVTNDNVESSSIYEVRVDWQGTEGCLTNGQIVRGTSAREVDLVATVRFNGVPLEDDGKIYFDDIPMTPVTEEEIKAYIIRQIMENSTTVLTDGVSMWNNDTKYGTAVTWISGDSSVASIANNKVSVNQETPSGKSLNLTARVNYATDEGSASFELSYVVTVETNCTVIEQGSSLMSDELRAAIMSERNLKTLTTESLKNTTFVTLDLSKYPQITSLKGLQYCENLRWLNISGLRVDSLAQIAALKDLEILIAKDCALTDFSNGGEPVLANMRGLRVLDLSGNKLTDLHMVFGEDRQYSKLIELYLHDNQLVDVSEVTAAPFLQTLTLSGNKLTDSSIEPLSACDYLKYLSLGNNALTDVSSLANLTALTELRLQHNAITSVVPLVDLTGLKALYLGHNRISEVDALRLMTQLRILYLNDNALSGVDALSALKNLNVVNISNNDINNINTLVRAVTSNAESTVPDAVYAHDGVLTLRALEGYGAFTGMVDLFAENNSIADISRTGELTTLRKLALANNGNFYDDDLHTDLAGLTNLTTLTLSGKPLTNLSFLTNMTKLVRLEVAHCGIPSCVATAQDQDGTIKYTLDTDNILQLAGLKKTLMYLDISDNPFDFVGNASDFVGTSPVTLSKLSDLSDLVVLYADNVPFGDHFRDVLSMMTRLQYLSAENAGITCSTSVLSANGYYVLVDLAGNNITKVDLADLARSKGSLKYLYLDTTADNCGFADAFVSFNGNVLKELSLHNVKLKIMDYLPNMKAIEYLDLSDSGLVDFAGSGELYSIGRFDTLRYLDVSQTAASIFTKSNLELLYENFADRQVNLYAREGKYSVPEGFEADNRLNAAKEGTMLLSFIDNMVDEVQIADLAVSTNNPELIQSVGDYAVSWSLSNNTNFCFENNQLAIKSLAGIYDQDLVFTAYVSGLYGTEAVAAQKDFSVFTDIVRLNSDAYVKLTCMAGQKMRGESVAFLGQIIDAKTSGFADAVKPVNYGVHYEFTATDKDGVSIPWTDVLTQTETSGRYAVSDTAPIGAVVTMKVFFTCQEDPSFDLVRYDDVKVVARSYTLQIDPVGGTAYTQTADGMSLEVDSITAEEEATVNITALRKGYTLEGWYLDEDYQMPFDGKMVSSNEETIYAKWTPNDYTVTLDPNGGQVSDGSVTVTYTSTYPEVLPEPTRIGYTFVGWYSALTDGELITGATVVSIPDNHTLYARWEANEYDVVIYHNEGLASVTTVHVKYDSPVVLPSLTSATAPMVIKNTFLGYSRDPNATVPEYYANENLGNLSTGRSPYLTDSTEGDVMLYGVWAITDSIVQHAFDSNVLVIGSSEYKYTLETGIDPVKLLANGYTHVKVAFGLEGEGMPFFNNAPLVRFILNNRTVSYEMPEFDNGSVNTVSITISIPLDAMDADGSLTFEICGSGNAWYVFDSIVILLKAIQ